jgi:hypothetical protein
MGKVAACMARWGEGRSWEEAGAYARSLRAIAKKGSLDGCRTLDDVVQRYLKLDEVFARVSNEGRLRTRAELEGPAAFRELGGIFINIDRDGRPVAGGGGWHRLAIARILHLPVIPAQVGLVHPAALPSWRQRFSAPAAAGSEPPAA